MKKISILLLVALSFAACQKKEPYTGSFEKKDEVQIKNTMAVSTPAATQKEYDYETTKSSGYASSGATTESDRHEADKDALVEQPTALSLAAASVTSYNQVEEKPKEEKNINTATIKNRVETKEPSQIIKNALISFQVENTDSSHDRIAKMISANNAYFGSDKRIQNGYSIQQMMVIRVPFSNFEKVMDELMKESIYTDNKDITADDVTAEFVDIQARLKSKKEVEKRYTELLNRAQKVSDVLEVESNLRVIREEIESTEGRLKLLKDQVAYSTITLTTTQKLKGDPQPEINFTYRLKEAGINGWRGLEFFALSMVTIWPFLLMVSPFIIWIVIRRRKHTAK